MNKLALAVTAIAALGVAATSTANGEAQIQGPQLTGIALQSLASDTPVVTAVTLPSGQTTVLRPRAAE